MIDCYFPVVMRAQCLCERLSSIGRMLHCDVRYVRSYVYIAFFIAINYIESLKENGESKKKKKSPRNLWPHGSKGGKIW